MKILFRIYNSLKMSAVFLLIVYFCIQFPAFQVSGEAPVTIYPVVVTNSIDRSSNSPKWSISFGININENRHNVDRFNEIVAQIVLDLAITITTNSLISTSKNYHSIKKFLPEFGDSLSFKDLFVKPPPSKAMLQEKFQKAAIDAFGMPIENLLTKRFFGKVTSEEIVGLFNGDLLVSVWEKCRETTNEILAEHPNWKIFTDEVIKEIDRLQGGSLLASTYIKEFLNNLGKLN